MKKPILKVLVSHDVTPPTVAGYVMITTKEVELDGHSFVQFEYINEGYDLCEGGNARREGDFIVIDSAEEEPATA